MILPVENKRRPVRSSTVGAVALGVALLVGAPSATAAHEIPARVTVLAFVAPRGDVLSVVMRVPLAAMRDVDLPLRGPGYLDLPRTTPLLAGAARIWLADYMTVYEDGAPLAVPRIVAARLSLPSDRSFTEYQAAVASIAGAPLPAATDLPWQQAMVDVVLAYPIHSDRSRFAIHPALAHLGLRTSTVLRFRPPEGAERAYEYEGDPGLVELDPRWHQAALRFVRMGFAHILGGLDHLLFILCLVIPFRRVRPLIAIVTAFTVAHSITLVASAAGFAPDALWFPPLIELLVALSIVYMALENIVGAQLDRRWRIAFAFGLVHGFAFSFAVRQSMQFAGSHLVMSLLSFNVGVELGQLLVLAVAVPALAWLLARLPSERVGMIVASALVAHTAWHWMLDRGEVLRRYRFELPGWNLVTLVSVMRALMVLLVAMGALWLVGAVSARLARPPRRGVVGAD